jgi:hypothetical protein
VVVGGVFWRDGSQEVARLTAIIWLNMEDFCILCNVIENFCRKKVTKIEGGGNPLALSSSKWHWHNHVKTHWFIYVDIQILQLLMGGIDQWGVNHDSSFLWLEPHRRQGIFELRKIREVNPFMLGWQQQCWLGCECHFWWAQCRLISERSWTWTKEMHVVVFLPHGSQYLTW